MTQMSPALDAALAGERATVFAAISMNLPGRNVRLIVGSGFVTFGGETYTGRDDVIGVFSDIDDLTDGVGAEAPAITITFMTPSDAGAAELASPEMQGAPVQIYLGAVDPPSGLVIDTLLIFNGLLDVAKIKLGDKGRTVVFDVTSIFEDFFEGDDGARLSDGFHQYLWPGELGCSFVTYVTHQIYWGQTAPDGVSK